MKFAKYLTSMVSFLMDPENPYSTQRMFHGHVSVCCLSMLEHQIPTGMWFSDDMMVTLLMPLCRMGSSRHCGQTDARQSTFLWEFDTTWVSIVNRSEIHTHLPSLTIFVEIFVKSGGFHYFAMVDHVHTP
jgi:hypothetical protein